MTQSTDIDQTQLGSVESVTTNGVTTVTFEHPLHNSLPGRLLAKLAQSITDAGDDDATRVIILKSGGDRTFCAGANFDEMLAIDDLESGKKFFMGFANVINACRKCPKLIIGRVHGKAIGGGVGVAAATDFCFATKFASIKLSELAVGIGPFVVSPAIERKIGVGALSQIGIDARSWYDANWAREKGLYAKVYDTAEEMDAGIAQLAEQLAGSNPEAMQEMKRVFWRGTDHWDDLLETRAERSGTLVLSDYARSEMGKFKNK